MTEEGYKKLMDDLNYLESVERPSISRQIAEARDKGDLSENAEYDAAKNEQADLEERIHKLETMIRKAKIIDENEMPKDHVNLGLKVKIKVQESGLETEYTIVGSTEADPFEGKISNESAVGNALMGQKLGSVVEIQVPDGLMHYEILDIYK